jgi:hypothetical protein
LATLLPAGNLSQGLWAKTSHCEMPTIISPQRIEARKIRMFITFVSEAAAFFGRGVCMKERLGTRSSPLFYHVFNR